MDFEFFSDFSEFQIRKKNRFSSLRIRDETITDIEFWCLLYTKNIIRSDRYCISYFDALPQECTGIILKEICESLIETDVIRSRNVSFCKIMFVLSFYVVETKLL